MPSLVLLQRDHEASPHLRAVIESSSDFQVADVSHTVADAAALIDAARPDILVTDLQLQDGDTLGLLSALRKQGNALRPHVLVTLVSHDDATLVKALRAGADGYWVHACSPELLLSTMAQLMRGESPMTPMIAREVLTYFDAPAPLLNLTRSEREMLECVARGYLIDEIAQQCQASVHSLACGIRRVYRKLQCDWHISALTLL